MKKSVITSILAVLTAAMTIVSAQDYPEEYLGLPGDNLNLYAVMKLFQESETLEAFERNLNEENSRINNLDLNGDNLVDYLTVTDYPDGNVHTIVLRAVLGRNDYQDVAVFTVERFRNGSVQIQLIGDEALYGKNYIIEPNYAETPNPGYTGKYGYRRNVTVVTTSYYDIAAWPVIRFIYLPTYIGWRSAWYWGYYPVYWNPWRPYYWHFYYGYHYHWHHHYYAHYRYCDRFRFHRYHDYYYSRIRVHSPLVVININKGNYKKTYSRPEMRREGEALYTRTYGNQGGRERSSATVAPQARRSTSAQPVRTGTSTRTASGTRQKTSAAVSNRGNNTSANRSTVVARRTEPAAAERTISTRSSTGHASAVRTPSSTTVKRNASVSSSGRQAATVRSSSAGLPNRTVSKSATVRHSSPSRSSHATVSARSSAPRPAGQKAAPARTSSRPSAAVNRSSGQQKSTGHSRTTQQQSRSSRDSGNSRTSRR